ncbi:MAG: ketoacyl-ACP synthase III [Myxococcota bacterium]|nr:ketoacyl-ACP synthase III [Myxococcota bacterium]
MQLLSLGHAHPETEISNAFLESLDIGTSDAWILERVGIRSRRSVLPLDYLRETRNRDVRAAPEAAAEDNGALGARAARMALERAGLAPSDIGLVVAGGSAPSSLTPADACTIAAELGIEAPAFDVSSACTSFLVQLDVLSRMAPTLPDAVLVVGVDTLTTTTSYDDRAAAVLWGDGAAAAVVSPRLRGRARVLSTEVCSSPAGADKVRVPRTGHFSQDGRAVQMFAIRKTAEGFERLREAHAAPERSLHLVAHQANLRMLEAVCRKCEIDPALHHSNVALFGNTGAPGSASVVSQAFEKWTPRDDVALIGVGGGLTWASLLLRFEESA